jgi:hypothetical protein
MNTSIFFTSKLCVYKIRLSDDDYPKNTKKGEYKSQVPYYVIPSNDSLTVLVPNTFTTILFGSACNVCYSRNIALPISTHKAKEKISITFTFCFFLRYENKS